MIAAWQRALVLAPHTDDGEFGCGGTAARLVEAGCEVRYVAFSIATRSLPPGFAARHAGPRGARGDGRARHPGDAPDRARLRRAHVPRPPPGVLELLVEMWNDWEPDLVFQPSLHDIHQDHQTIAQEGLRAFKRTTILGYEIPWNNFDFAYGATSRSSSATSSARSRRSRLRVAAAPALRERRVHPEPREDARHQREPRVRRGLPGVPHRRLIIRSGTSMNGSAASSLPECFRIAFATPSCSPWSIRGRRAGLPRGGRAARGIPGVEAFELLAEASPKNGYRFGISMEFADRAAYARYNEHPDHVRFVQERWLAEVSDFLELDYTAR